ncbi:hypothetical protein G4B88_016129 [Cannabis sativa]|uniref:Uncharacterized protein n=1 Tax=Cannabis sativa TaxID=3483 RepID=A0A7J6FH49_CANSA|nr:hypothetical protein G4B88_016129 [Cannabis sativa]
MDSSSSRINEDEIMNSWSRDKPMEEEEQLPKDKALKPLSPQVVTVNLGEILSLTCSMEGGEEITVNVSLSDPKSKFIVFGGWSWTIQAPESAASPIQTLELASALARVPAAARALAPAIEQATATTRTEARAPEPAVAPNQALIQLHQHYENNSERVLDRYLQRLAAVTNFIIKEQKHQDYKLEAKLPNIENLSNAYYLMLSTTGLNSVIAVYWPARSKLGVGPCGLDESPAHWPPRVEGNA